MLIYCLVNQVKPGCPRHEAHDQSRGSQECLGLVWFGLVGFSFNASLEPQPRARRRARLAEDAPARHAFIAAICRELRVWKGISDTHPQFTLKLHTHMGARGHKQIGQARTSSSPTTDEAPNAFPPVHAGRLWPLPPSPPNPRQLHAAHSSRRPFFLLLPRPFHGLPSTPPSRLAPATTTRRGRSQGGEGGNLLPPPLILADQRRISTGQDDLARPSTPG